MFRRSQALLSKQRAPTAWDLLAHAVANSVPEYGFTRTALLQSATALDAELDVQQSSSSSPSADAWVKLLSDNSVRPLYFPRGLDIALVEYAVIAGNMAVKKHLNALVEEAASSPATLSTPASSAYQASSSFSADDASKLVNAAVDSFVETASGKPAQQQQEEKTEKPLLFPSWQQVVHEGLRTKLHEMQPYIHQWHQAIVLEAYPSNAPHAVKNLALMADDIRYFAERSHRYSLQHSITGGGGGGSAVLLGPTSGPNVSLEWYFVRAKVMALYGAAVLHMMGDESVAKQDTFKMLDCAVKTSFW